MAIRCSHLLTSNGPRALAIVLASSFVAAGGQAWAQEASSVASSPLSTEQKLARAKEREQRGVSAFRAGDFQASIEAFLEADRLVPSAALSFNVARAYDRLGDVARSLFWYSDYLRRAPDTADSDHVRQLVQEREAKLAAKGNQLLVVRTEPAGAAVAVDGVLAGTSPCAVVVPLGTHDVSLTQPGGTAQVSKVDLKPAAHVELFVEMAVVEVHAPQPGLMPTAATPPAPVSAPVVVSPKATATTRQINPSELDDSRETASPSTNWWAWGAVATGGAAVVTAGAFEIARRGAEADARAAQVQLDKQAALERNDDYASAARWVGALGAASLLTGGLIFLLDTPSPSGASERAFFIAPTGSGVEVGMVGEIW